MRKFSIAFVMFLTISLLGGCALVKLWEDVQFSKDSCLILSIAADGCEPYTTTVNVHPGEFIPPSPFRLITK